LVEHALELVDAPLSVFGLALGVCDLALQLVVAAEQIVEQPLRLTRIVGEA
jgi:hypothetical protein